MNTNPTPSHDEQELIAFHLGEPCDTAGIRARLDRDPAFATLSEEIAHTLRVFSAEPVPTPGIDRAWQQLRPTLPARTVDQHHRRALWRRVLHPIIRGKGYVPHVRNFGRGFFPIAATLAAALLLITIGMWHRHAPRPSTGEAGVLHLPLPTQAAGNAAMTQHLDQAERWLTAVNHTSAPLDASTRAEGTELLTRNALFLQTAQAHGDLPDAAVLDRLGRVLTTANHPAESGLQLRVQMNTEGLLFELRILRQNQSSLTGDAQ